MWRFVPYGRPGVMGGFSRERPGIYRDSTAMLFERCNRVARSVVPSARVRAQRIDAIACDAIARAPCELLM
jgi:hypothetical protein